MRISMWAPPRGATTTFSMRSGERRVGEKGRSWGVPDHLKKKKIDRIVYPAVKVNTGASLALPSGCTAARRGDWARWQISSSSWVQGFTRTTHAHHDDVPCK